MMGGSRRMKFDRIMEIAYSIVGNIVLWVGMVYIYNDSIFVGSMLGLTGILGLIMSKLYEITKEINKIEDDIIYWKEAHINLQNQVIKNKRRLTTMGKYNIKNRLTGKILKGITIDESAKEDFKLIMDWSEKDWNNRTAKLKD